MCTMRHKAIKAGVILPPSYLETIEAGSEEKTNSLDSYFKGPKFTPDLMNMILVLWVVRHALPWARFEDPALRAAFYTVNCGAMVRSRTWAAQQAVLLHSSLHKKAINTVKVSLYLSSKSLFSVASYTDITLMIIE